MKLQSLRLRNYRSVLDSKTVAIADSVTVFAGKNESGKTALLQGVCDIVNAREDLPIDVVTVNASGVPSVELRFSISDAELLAAIERARVALTPELQADLLDKGVAINVTPRTIGWLGDTKGISDSPEVPKALTTELLERVRKFADTLTPLGIRPPNYSTDLEEAYTETRTYFSALDGAIAEEKIELDDEEVAERELLEAQLVHAKPINAASFRLAQAVFHAAPQFVYFNEFTDLVPFEIPLKDAKDNKAVANLAHIANLDLDAVVAATDSYARMNLLERHSATITGDLNEYWTQDKLDVVFRDRGDNLSIAFREHGNTTLFKAEQRSKGFQWFLSFYAAMQDIDFASSIIFIDEPGTFLHAAAQQNVLKYLREVASRGGQVLYSTHSPYLIDTDALQNLRLVIKDVDVTRVENKYYKEADKDTLTPVITAIGLDFSGALNIGRDNNALFEGVSDAYFCSGMRALLNEPRFDALSLVPCLGSTTVGTLLSVLTGWGYRAVAVLDNDTAGKREGSRIERAYPKGTAPLLYVSKVANEAIEDLFTRDDFDNIVLEGIDVSGRSEPLNSRYAKASVDKIGIARRFADRAKAGELSLSADTMNRFRQLFEQILTRLGS